MKKKNSQRIRKRYYICCKFTF